MLTVVGTTIPIVKSSDNNVRKLKRLRKKRWGQRQRQGHDTLFYSICSFY